MDYNFMQNIQIEKCLKYSNKDRFERIENGIYLDSEDEDDTKYRMTISYELVNETEGNNNQYPLEDILDKYFIYVSDFLEAENEKESNRYKYELGGELEDLKKAQEIIGKKVFNREFKDEDGQTRVKLAIE